MAAQLKIPFNTWRVVSWECVEQRLLSGNEPWDTYELTLEYKTFWGLFTYRRVQRYTLTMFHNWREVWDRWDRHKEWYHILQQQKQNSDGINTTR